MKEGRKEGRKERNITGKHEATRMEERKEARNIEWREGDKVVRWNKYNRKTSGRKEWKGKNNLLIKFCSSDKMYL